MEQAGSEIHKVEDQPSQLTRQRILLSDNWRFYKYADNQVTDSLIYDVRPEIESDEDGKAADAKPTEAVDIVSEAFVLKPWILPTANPFIDDPAQQHQRPEGNPGADFAFVQGDFDDSQWQQVQVPHDWAISGPFYVGHNAPVGGGMGRLPSPGVGWYRQHFELTAADAEKSIFLDIDGAMSYAMVWLNGHLVGGWPYGYASFRLDLTPYIKLGEANQLAIRIDNPPASSRWYPGGGLYRNVWLTKTNPVHVGQWGTAISSSDISEKSAKVSLSVTIDNDSAQTIEVSTQTNIYALDMDDVVAKSASATIATDAILIDGGQSSRVDGSVVINNPKLWGPLPNQQPNRYVAVTNILQAGKVIDSYETRFGIRELHFDANKGLIVNGEHIYFQGVNQHHDLGALGAAFNVRAAQRQLELLREMGVNAIRLAHNPPAVELLELTDKMGFVVIDEIFDVWERKKTPLDFHLIFPEWAEPDLRAFIRRDRNSPSVVMWSIGNEVGEQYTGADGAKLAQRLQNIAKQEDTSRPTAASMNFAKPDMPLSAVFDTVSLNYQGEGIRNAPAYAHLQGIRTAPLYPAFHQAFPNKVIMSSENAAAVSSRGEYLFPVNDGVSAPVADGAGGDPESLQVSAYELYTAPFGSSADKVLASLAQHPYVSGGFIWSGWDYLGEPTPYYLARSSYFGVIDLAGFKKDRFYLYQSMWRPDFPMAHILPHWNWPERIGKITPVHVFTSGDEAELFLNGRSLGRKQKAEFAARLRWDDVVYEPGELKVQAYKLGKPWAENKVVTTGAATALAFTPDRAEINADGVDLSFVTVKVVDKDGLMVPRAKHQLSFSLQGPGEIVATDNGDSANLVAFPSHQRAAFNGLALVIIKAKKGEPGNISLSVEAEGLEAAHVSITSK
ncbi:beta-galactosidase [Paraglaciecola hydrolytica]|uniref:Beta-galactosidase n=1 Tax=Paraglaciecola hydrolytica TaxID=1799789 RepID=A0A148KLM8_9ALTE|nr:beta-galactosidase [Paraglaciecola hydrolytica]